MYYAKARFYSAEDKRFVSMDPIKGNITEPLSLVAYVYCVDNPLRWVDPLGLVMGRASMVNAMTSDGGGGRKTPDTTQDELNTKDDKPAIYMPETIDTYWFPFLLPDPFFKRDEEQRIWWADIDALQRFGGYNDFYNFVFTVVDYSRFISIFEYDEYEWRIEGWKGNYLNMGVGAEIGIYYRPAPATQDMLGAMGGAMATYGLVTRTFNPTPTLSINDTLILGGTFAKFICEDHYFVPPEEFWGNMKIQFDLYYQEPKTSNKYLIFSLEERSHWWLNGFRPDIGTIPSEDLLLIGSITFLSPEMAKAFYEHLDRQDIVPSYNEGSSKIEIYWEGGGR